MIKESSNDNAFLNVRTRIGSVSEWSLNLILAIIGFFLVGYVLSMIKFKSDAGVMAIVKIVVPKDDELQLFYVPVKDKGETEENSVIVPVAGKFVTQTVSFLIPDSVNVKFLRLDVGQNKKQGTIIIEQVVLNYNGGTLVLLDKKHGGRFHANEFLEALGGNKFVPKKSGESYDPFLYSEHFASDYDRLTKRENRISHPYIISLILVLSAFLYTVFAKIHLLTIRNFYTFASCVFVFLLLLPVLSALFGIDTGKNTQEQRRLAGRPELTFNNVKEYPRLFEKYYNDNFPFREKLVNLGSVMKYYLFNTSSTPDKASVGKDGWIFLSGKFYWVTQDLTRENLFTPDELKKTVSIWESRMDTLARDSIGYYRAFWPDKHLIYPDKLPFSMQAILRDTITKCDQGLAYLSKTRSKLKLIDVRTELLSAKEKGFIYYRYDSHWNATGALIAYNKFISVMSKDFPVLKTVDTSGFLLDSVNNYRGDLASLLGLSITEQVLRYRLKDSTQVQSLDVSVYPPKTKIYYNSNSRTDLELLLFRDSFTEQMIPFLRYHFRKVTLFWDTPFNYSLVRKIKPHIVVEGFASRYF